MVGLILNYSNNKFLQSKENQKALSSLKLANWMNMRIINHDNNSLLQFISYDGYPFLEFSNDQYKVFIEGKIYNKSLSEIRNNIYTILDNVFKHKKDYKKLNDWLQNTDGDFIIYVFEKKTGQIIIFNDFLGRLPAYYYLENDKLIFSRSLKYIVESSGSNIFDKYSLAQNLLLGYSLGDNTLFPNIKRLKPSSIIHIIPNEKKIIIKKISIFDYSVKKNIKLGRNNHHVEYLSDLFAQACKNRTIGIKDIIVSLSGGLDSRIVAGGLNKAKVNFISTTLRDPWKVNDFEGNLEVEIAQRVAEVTNSTSIIVDGKLARGLEFSNLLHFKDGMNHLGLGYLLRYLNDVQKKYSSKIVFFTGDGGDKVVKYQPPSGKINSYIELFEYILKIHKRFSIENVSLLTGIKESDIQEYIIEHLKTYPEKTFNDKYVHFIFNERVNNWLFEGEDRNRHFFWSVTPFYSLDFFTASMQTPHKMKKRNKLYIDMLNVFNSELNNIVYANLKWPVNSFKSKMFLLAKDTYNSFPNSYRKKLKKMFGNESIIEKKHNQTIELLNEHINMDEYLFGEYLDIKSIENYEKFSSDELKMLLNIVLTVQHFSGKNKLLENYLEKEFSFK